MQPTIAAVGIHNVGKSTGLNAAIGDTICESRVTESTALPTTLMRDPEKAQTKVYGVMDGDGHTRYAPLSQLTDYTPKDNDCRLFLYHNSTPLADAVFIDVPGRASISKTEHNQRAAEFVADPSNYDILLDILTPRCTELTLTQVPTPTPRIVLINKVDELANWSATDPLAIIETTVSTYREEILSNVEDGIEPCVIGYAAIVGLASEMFDDDLLNRLLQLTKTHGKDLLSNSQFFRIEEAKAIVDAANSQLTAPWWNETRPAYPAIKFAIGLAMSEGIADADVLRQRMYTLSGMDTLQQTLLTLIPLTQCRRETLKLTSRYESDALKLETELAEIRALITDTERLSHKHRTNLASTEERAYLKKMRSYLAKHACVYSKLSHLTQQASDDTEQQYTDTVNDAVREPLGT